MTDLANASALTRTPAQLPLTGISISASTLIEQRVLFNAGPGYVGHELMVPNVGDYYTLGRTDTAALRWCATTPASRCSRTYAATARPSFSTGAATCKTSCARFIAGPTICRASCSARPEFPDNPCLDLPRTALNRWNGLLFSRTAATRRPISRISR